MFRAANADSKPVSSRYDATAVPVVNKKNAFQYSTPKMNAMSAPIAAPLPGSGTATNKNMNKAPYLSKFFV